MTLYLLPLVIFLAVACVTFGAYQVITSMADPSQRKLRRRLEGLGDKGMKTKDERKADVTKNVKVVLNREDDFPGWTRPLMNFGPAQTVTDILAQGTPDLKLDKFLVMCGVCAGVGFLVILVLAQHPLVALIAASVTAFLPLFWVMKKRNTRQRLMEDQLPNALDFMSRALRAGHSLSTGLAMMGTELPQPLAGEFQKAYDEHALGVDMDTVLRSTVQRIESVDYAFFITAVLIQRQTGGDLSKVLDNIGDMIRGRIKLQKQVKAKTAEGRFTGYVLTVFPMVMFVICYILNPDNWGVMLSTTPGLLMMGGTIVMSLVGLFMIRKLTQLKV